MKVTDSLHVVAQPVVVPECPEGISDGLKRACSYPRKERKISDAKQQDLWVTYGALGLSRKTWMVLEDGGRQPESAR